MRTTRLLGAVAVVALTGACTGGEPTRAELAGVDVDNNGVRDDVDTLVEALANGNDTVAAYLHDIAHNMQLVVTLDTDAGNAVQKAHGLTLATDRLLSCPPDDLDDDEAFTLLEQVQNAVTNTPERRAKVDRLSELIDGQAFVAPDCDAPAPGTATPER